MMNTFGERLKELRIEKKIGQVELAKELVKIQEKSFAQGMATSLEVANAHTLLAKSTTAAATIYCQYDITLAMLLAITGESSSFLSYSTSANLIYH